MSKRELRKTEIIRLAVELFSAKGYEHVSMADIAASLGKGRTTIYEYFPGKEEILVNYLLDTMNGYVQKVTQAVKSANTFPEKLYNFCRTQLTFNREHYKHRQLMQALGHAGSTRSIECLNTLRISHSQIFRIIEAELDNAMGKGELRFLPPALITQVLLHATSLPLTTDGSDDDALARQLTDFFLGGLRAEY